MQLPFENMKGKMVSGKGGYRCWVICCHFSGGNVNNMSGVVGNAADQFYMPCFCKPVIIDTMAFLSFHQLCIQLQKIIVLQNRNAVKRNGLTVQYGRISHHVILVNAGWQY